MKKLSLTIHQWETILSSSSNDIEDIDNDSGVVNVNKNNDSSLDKDTFQSYFDKNKKKKDKKKQNTIKTNSSETHEIIVNSATQKVSRGKYGKANWVASKKEDGGWKIRSRLKLNGGQKSSISGKINKFLKQKRVK